MNQGVELPLVEPDALREERHVDPPLILGVTSSSRAIDDDLALAQAQVPAIDQPAGEDLLEEPFVTGEGREQDERSDAGGHGPVQRALDILAKRRGGWCLRILWELRQGVPMTFRILQSAAETNPALLNTRLAELRSARLVGHNGDGYLLTSIGAELLVALRPFSEWARRWGTEQQRSRGTQRR
jgi:DNA-binding HxlR family transcriptional regulator